MCEALFDLLVQALQRYAMSGAKLHRAMTFMIITRACGKLVAGLR